MPQNTIDFPDDLYAGLRAAAAANRRTIKAEVLTMVEQAVRWRRIRDGRPEGTEPTRLALHDDITQCPRPVDVTRAADRGPYGAGQRLICWHHTLHDAIQNHAALTATSRGVIVGQHIYLTDIPDEWVAAAKAAHRALADGADVSHLATHRTRFPGNSGPLEPATPEARES